MAMKRTSGLDRELERRPEGEREVLVHVFSEAGRLLLEGSPEKVLRLECSLREELSEERLPENPAHVDERLLRELEARICSGSTPATGRWNGAASPERRTCTVCSGAIVGARE
jgi:hypothetical protein